MSEITQEHADEAESASRQLYDIAQRMRDSTTLSQFSAGELIDVRRRINRMITDIQSAHYRSLPKAAPSPPLDRDAVLREAVRIHNETGCHCDPKYVMSCPKLGAAILKVGNVAEQRSSG